MTCWQSWLSRAAAAFTGVFVSRRRRVAQDICQGCVEQTTLFVGSGHAGQAGICQEPQGVFGTCLILARARRSLAQVHDTDICLSVHNEAHA